jgi:hypothetical protein
MTWVGGVGCFVVVFPIGFQNVKIGVINVRNLLVYLGVPNAGGDSSKMTCLFF